MHRTILETAATVLIVIWLLGTVSSYTFGGLIHILLVAGIAILILEFTLGRS